jgi:predicted SprT family Zn-dependent metalloprotease
MIGLVDQNFIEPNLAMTRTLTSNRTRQIVMSKILIKADSATKQRVLEHEFGHALGWRHFNRRYHIMNSEWDRGGWTTTGLRRSEQIEILEDTVPEAFEDLSDEEYLDSF